MGEGDGAVEAMAKVSWDTPLNEATAELLSRHPDRERWTKAVRRHVDVFHAREWPSIRERLRKEFRIEVGDNEEPHWMEPWKVAYWHPSTDLRGRTTWSLTMPIPADAASIAHYWAKGWRFRQPVQAVEAAAPISAQTPILPEAGPPRKGVCPECGWSNPANPGAIGFHMRKHRKGKRAEKQAAVAV